MRAGGCFDGDFILSFFFLNPKQKSRSGDNRFLEKVLVKRVLGEILGNLVLRSYC
jgi:hypothetical protein